MKKAFRKHRPEQELRLHRQTMRGLETEAEREEYRARHHERMLERAREQGVELSDKPGQRGKGQRRSPGERQGQNRLPAPAGGSNR